MRTLLSRYVFSELLKVFLVSLAGITLLIILVGVGLEAVRQGLGIGAIVRLVPYILPDALRFSVPATILFAACSVFGRMSGAGEVTAIKSLGISPMVVVRPALVLAFLLSLVAVWLNDVAVSWGRQGVQRVVVQSVEQIVYGMLRAQGSYSTKRLSIHVRRIDGRKLIGPRVVYHKPGDVHPVTLSAEEAELRSNPEDQSLSIFVTNYTIDEGGRRSMFDPGRREYVVPLAVALRKGEVAARPSNMPLWQVPRETERQRRRIRELRQSLAARAAFEMASGDFDALTGPAWAERHRELAAARRRLDCLRTAPWRRWANGFSCFFFVLVGIPLAVRLKNADITTTFILCFLPILVVYYPLLIYGADRAKAGAVPPYSVWLGNAICLVAGILLMRRVMRY